MGLGYEDCQKINERLIYASITGRYIHSYLYYPRVFQDMAKQVLTEQLQDMTL